MIVPQSLFDGLGALLPDIGIVAVADAPQAIPPFTATCVLLVEAIQDPGNLGSMLRSAAAFGVTSAWMSKDCAFAWSPKVLRAGQGAHFQLAVHEDADLGAVADALAAMACGSGDRRVRRNADRPRDGRARVALAVGNEGAGLSAGLRQRPTRRDDPDAGGHRVAERRRGDGGRALRDRAARATAAARR